MGREGTGGTVSNQGIMDDGNESTGHMRDDQRKGARGANDEHVSNVHRAPNQRKEPMPDRPHPGQDRDKDMPEDEPGRPGTKPGSKPGGNPGANKRDNKRK
jgi:hypothetical protein